MICFLLSEECQIKFRLIHTNPTDDLFSVENPPGYVVNDVQLHAANFAYVENTYLKFPLSQISPSSTIVSATLRLFEVLEWDISRPNDLGVYYSPNDNWSESSPYGQLPIVGSLISTAQYPGNWLNWMEWNLLSHDFSSDLADGYLTLVLKNMQSINLGWNMVLMASSEYSNQTLIPQLLITTVSNEYTLTVTKSGTGTGTITSTPEGISCGVNCAYDFNEGTPVTLIASADEGSLFESWQGCDTVTNNQCTVTMGTAKQVEASFINTETYHEWVVVIDGLDFGSTFTELFPWDDNPTTYLYYAMFDDSVSSKTRKRILKDMAVLPFPWSRDAEKTDEAVENLTALLRSITRAKLPTDRLVILSHSWGTVLAYLVLSNEDNQDIFVDKLITLGSPLSSQFMPVWLYTRGFLLTSEALPVMKTSNMGTWNNYWAKRDCVSGEISQVNNFGDTSKYLNCYTAHCSYYKKSKKWNTILKDMITP